MSKKTFSADVAQLLKLVTHSIYSNKEIFVRELIANANDAIQKAKILAAGDATYLGDEVDLNIKITLDKDKKTLTLEDTGIGMSIEDVESHIGTIAKSGTKSFLEKLKDMKDTPNNLVGQFGIGFYSAFMVADKVEIFTKANDSDGVYRSSTGDADYEIKKDKKSDRGTRIVLHLNDESTEYLEDYRMRSLIRKYADYIPVPILMEKKSEEISEEEKNEDSKNQDLGTKNWYEQVNSMTAIRQKNKKDVTAEEYTKHFQSLAFGTDNPLDTIHLNIEWAINYKAVLYIPSKPNPFVDLNDPSKEYGPALYVQNVMIMNHCKDLLPAWMRNIVGVVETPDLPLNVSREILQQSSIMNKIQTSLIKEVMKSLGYLKKEQASDYMSYFSHFGRLLKEGVYYDHERREDIAGLLYFESNKHPTFSFEEPIGWVTLDAYIEENIGSLQWLQSIYYLHTLSSKEGTTSPHLNKMKKRNLDVIFMTDPIDEYMLSMLRTYKWYECINIASSDVKLPELADEQKKQKSIKKSEKEYQEFLNLVQTSIGNEKLEKVSFWQDLDDSIAILSTPDGQPTTQMLRMMKAMWQELPIIKKTLMVNPDHSLVRKYLSLYQSDPASPQLHTFIKYIYDQALLLEWWEVESMHQFLLTAQELMK